MSTIPDGRTQIGPVERDQVGLPSEALVSHRPVIENYIRARARTREDAEDLVQNVFLRATRALPTFRDDCPLSHWLLRIAANELKNYYRRLSGEVPTSDFDWERENSENLQQISTAACPALDADSRMTIEKLMAVMREVCNEEESNVIQMVYQGESFDEIAELLDAKSTTIRTHFLRGRTKLLAHIVACDSEFVGGARAILAAMKNAESCLEEGEIQALHSGKEKSSAFRSGCLKLARYLHLPTSVVLGAIWLN